MRIVLDILRPDSGTIAWNGRLNTEVPARHLGLPARGARALRQDEGPRPAGLLRQAAWRETEGGRAGDPRLAGALPDPGVRRSPGGAALQGQPAEDPVHRGDPPRPARCCSWTSRSPAWTRSTSRLLKEAFLEMRDRGKTLVFSTHQMETVEELCESIAILDRGRVVVGGSVRDVRRSTGRQVVRLAVEGDPEIAWLGTLDGVRVTQARPGLHRGGGGPGPRPGSGPAGRSGAQLPGPPFRDRRPFARADLHRARRADRHERANARPEGGATHERLANALPERLVRRRPRVPQPGQRAGASSSAPSCSRRSPSRRRSSPS